MFNLIKMDMHRLVHSVSTWIIMIFVAALAVFSVAMTNTDMQMLEEDPSSVVTDVSEDRQIGIYVDADPEWITGKIEIGSIISTEMRSGLLAIMCVIFAAIFTNAEQKNGYIKNIAGQFPHRGKLIVSKFIAIAVQVFLMLFVFTAVTVVAGFIFWGGKFYLGEISPILEFFCIQYLLHLGFASLIMFFSVLTHSSAFSMTAGILVCSGLAVPVYSIINKIFSDIRPNWNFDINNYVLDGNITRISLNAVSDVMLRGAAVGLAFALVSLVLSMVIIKKRDVR